MQNLLLDRVAAKNIGKSEVKISLNLRKIQLKVVLYFIKMKYEMGALKLSVFLFAFSSGHVTNLNF